MWSNQEGSESTVSLIFGRKRLGCINLVYNLLAVLAPILRWFREGTRSRVLLRLRIQAMSKLFETIRRLEKDPDSVAVESPVVSAATFPLLAEPMPRPVERLERIERTERPEKAERSVAIENGNSISLRWPVEEKPVEESPVERVGSRVMAISVDAGMVLIALGLFVGVFFLAGGVLTFAKDTPLLGSVLAIIALFYWFLCLLANQGSPGMHFAGIRPAMEENTMRQIAGRVDGQLGLNAPGPATPPAVPRVKAPQAVAAPIRPTIEELVTANKILANEKVLEAYGNISVRDERNSGRFFLARQMSGALVTGSDVTEYDLEGNPVSGDPFGAHAERFLHSEIYKARPDVTAIVQWRAADIIPFTASSVILRPVTQTAAFLGDGVPVIEGAKSEPGAGFTIRTRAAGQALAQSLGDKSAALLRGHGAIVVASSLHAAVARAYYTNMNARLQVQAIQLGGEVNYVQPAEPRALTPVDEFEPAWEFWKQRLPLNGSHR
jgi:ribulose-5-phosphate 4-epimerase/fuculose-1-phosphate aldolase